MKSKSPREIIEEEAKSHPEYEHGYIKFPGEQLRKDTWTSTQNKVRAIPFYADILTWLKGKSYNSVHTHPPLKEAWPYMPSTLDWADFISDNSKKTMTIASLDKKGGLKGYYIARKMGKVKPTLLGDFIKGPLNRIKVYRIKKHLIKEYSILFPAAAYPPNSLSAEYKQAHQEEFQDFLKEYGLKRRFVRAKELPPERAEKSKLEDAVVAAATTAIVALIASIFFLYSNITGNAIGSSATSNMMGVILFLVGIVGTFVYFRNRKK